MTYDKKRHHRRSIRLKGYDYSQPGLYFITICVRKMECLFGKIENEGMILNDFGLIAHREWEKLTERFSNFELDVFQIMPNHMHGIILLKGVEGEKGYIEEGAGVNPARKGGNLSGEIGAHKIGDIVGAYKSIVANECLKLFKLNYQDEFMGKLWHRDYYEHIIRNELSYQRISEYIVNNPKNWKKDKFQ
jgi:REP element-mobilizing transposase RayT